MCAGCCGGFPDYARRCGVDQIDFDIFKLIFYIGTYFDPGSHPFPIRALELFIQ